MFSVTVQDHMMIAHSLPDPFFGPAQEMHGATYLVQVRMSAPHLDAHGVVIDIGAAADHLAAIMADLSYRNLDEHPTFTGILTTTEVLARHVAEQMARALAGTMATMTGESHDEHRLSAVEATLHEHPHASASYRLNLPQPHDSSDDDQSLQGR
ncbi:MAG: 6-carboxytetrahydropterin synthase [Ornithinimicrobium sp.]